MPGLFGCVDQDKAKRALLGYRLRWYFVIVFSCIANFAALSIVLPGSIMFTALTLYAFAVIFIIFMNELEVIWRYAHPLSSEFSQPPTLEHKCYTMLWEALCTKVGFCSGGVYIVSPSDPLRGSEYLDTFGVPRHLVFSKERRLFVREEMLGKFTIMQIKAIMLHECGHLRWTSLLERHVLIAATLPISMLLFLVAALRQMVSQTHVAGTLLFLERMLYFVSIFHAVQSEEYAADAYAAQQMGTAKHIIDVLLKIEEGILVHIDDGEAGAGATREKNAHLHVHPLNRDRIAHLHALHNDHPHETTLS